MNRLSCRCRMRKGAKINDIILIAQTLDGYDVIRIEDGQIRVIPTDNPTYTTAFEEAYSQTAYYESPLITQDMIEELEYYQAYERSEAYDLSVPSGWSY